MKVATCAEEGYTGDIYCKDCNTKLSSGEKIAKKAHTWDKGKITTGVTCTQKGIKTYTCTVCNETKTEEIPATGHTIVDDKAEDATCEKPGKTSGSHCSVCGKVFESQ